MKNKEAAKMAIEALSRSEFPNSSDTISRQAAIDAADCADYTGLAIEDVKKVTDEVVKELKRLPSAQPEIIRCRDCKHYTLKPQVNSNNCYIRHCTRSALISSKPDDYCSWAERRTDG